MPTDFLQADRMLPDMGQKKSPEERDEEIIQYLYQLLGQLRYTLSNLGISNFNEAELAVLEEGITKPLYAKLTDAEGNIAVLDARASGLAARLTDAEGNLTVLTATASALGIRMENTEGDISALTQSAEAFGVRLSDAEGNISSVTQTATALGVRLSDAEGNISTVTQTAERINWLVASGTDASNFTLTPRAISLVSQSIDLTGYVSFHSLADTGQVTTINGAAIQTGVITSSTINSSEIYGSTIMGGSLTSVNGPQYVGVENGMILFTYNNVYNGMVYSDVSGLVVEGAPLMLNSTTGTIYLNGTADPVFYNQVTGVPYTMLHTGNIAAYLATLGIKPATV